MWSLLCPVIDCKEDKLPDIACTMYCSETIERNWSHVDCLTPISFDEFLSVDKLIPTTDILSVVQRNHHMHCICSEHSATSFVHFFMTMKYCVNWITEGIIEYCMLVFRFFCIFHVQWNNPALLLLLVCTLLPCYKIGDCTILQCCTNAEVWQMWIIMCWLSCRCTIAFLNLATNTLEIVIVQQMRKIVPRPELVSLIISSTYNDCMILSCVIWNLLSLSGYYNGFKRFQDE